MFFVFCFLFFVFCFLFFVFCFLFFVFCFLFFVVREKVKKIARDVKNNLFFMVGRGNQRKGDNIIYYFQLSRYIYKGRFKPR